MKPQIDTPFSRSQSHKLSHICFTSIANFIETRPQEMCQRIDQTWMLYQNGINAHVAHLLE